MARISRRGVIAGGGAGVGLVVAWALWPRRYRPNLAAAPGEHAFGAWLKVGEDGHVTVAVPQLEHGQGIWTALAQVVADELGADWRTVGVEPAPLNPLYANPVALDSLFEGQYDRVPEALRRTLAARATLMLTAGSSSIRMFEDGCRQAGAAARALLCMAAAKRWGVAWDACGVAGGFVVHGDKRLRFAALAAEAARLTPPDPLPIGMQGAGKLAGRAVPRLDAPAKVDGSATFAGDIRLPDMVHAAIRQGPTGDSRLVAVDPAVADRTRGVLTVVENPRWVAAVATTWWAAERALQAMAPRFATPAPAVDDARIAATLADALKAKGHRLAAVGEIGQLLDGNGVIAADYAVDIGLHAALETPSATAAYRDGRLELWLPTGAPAVVRAAAARAAGIGEGEVVVHPVMGGGVSSATLDPLVAEQAAILAVRLKRPVCLVWSRAEDIAHDRYRPPARARLSARLAGNGGVAAWQAAIAAPATGRALAAQLLPAAFVAAASGLGEADRYAVAGALPPYRIPAVAIDHHPADIGVPTGHVRGGAHGATCFFTESFVDELARAANSEPVSYRIGMLGGDTRLARCLSTVASLGGWGGGVPGSGQGIACHAFRGSFVAVLAEAALEDGRVRVGRLVAAVDCGRTINADLVLQAIEGGLIHGLAQATGATTGIAAGRATARRIGDLGLPRLVDSPDINIELIRSDEEPGGVAELAVPPVGPAVANALFAATGRRWRHLPLRA
ncbi:MULTISPECIES: molybdopterin cofactor-binding domain-containing protein [unclassified Sphingomonas]|uniref:molybdopterin cofactor-binding domain-containing protein n=1 Tax=unclassified Sphingomonas TaxID=196159 RepID=UPI000E103656|nr:MULTISPECIES: molybdopterin cofactor-binding domain-containing protein [unclassified Sphingomonas]AXJ95530.1 xanthine dehydrogenase family protein molybdopterin-binding subunit [Sphingomonas sp. FARSPH]